MVELFCILTVGLDVLQWPISLSVSLSVSVSGYSPLEPGRHALRTPTSQGGGVTANSVS